MVDKQVDESTSDNNNNVLCDIIAQQREFQLRQEARTSSSSIIKQKQQQKSFDWRNSANTINNLSSSINDTNNSGSNVPPQTKQGKFGKRKFSLSYAMSNLAPFGGGSSNAGGGGSTSSGGSSSSTAMDKQQQQQKLQHRASLVTDQFSAGQVVPKVQREKSQVPGGSTAHEKKKSFMHKAIRRGSKLFDSMLLSSAQHQASQEQQAEQVEQFPLDRHHHQNKPEELFPEEIAEQSNQQQQVHQRVQFAADIEPRNLDDKFNVELNNNNSNSNQDEPQKPRRRRLRLGSFQHDLKRALSLSSSHQQHKSHLMSHSTNKYDDEVTAAAAAATSSTLSLANNNQTGSSNFPTFTAANSQTALPTANSTSNSNLNITTTSTLASQTQANVKKPSAANHHQQNKKDSRLKRKNSLFAPLTSAASSAFYHAHHHHSARRRESMAANGSGDISSTLLRSNNLANNNNNNNSGSNNQQQQQQQTNSQSASFSLCQDHSRTYKLIIFGSSAVGKTSIIQRFLYGHFPVTHKPTVEELHSNKYNIPELGEIYLEILDTSGTFEFPAMRRLSIEKGDAFILVFSVADEASWQEVMHLRQLILEEKREQRLEETTNKSANSQSIGGSDNMTTTRNQTVGFTTPTPSSGEKNDEPISSVYAAAARLAAVGRRTSSSPGLEPSIANPNKGNQNIPTGSGTADQTTSGSTGGCGGPKSSIHYNSQLSKLLQQTPANQSISKSGKSNFLLQSLSIEDKDDEEAEEEDEEEDSIVKSRDNNNNRKGNLNVCKKENSKTSSRSSDLENSSNSLSQQNNENRQHPPQVPPTKRRTPIVVVANKCDLDTSSFQVDQDEAERLVCDQWRNSFVKCSAKEALNIDRVFKELLRQAKAPEILSQFVIDDHQQRRQSLPVLKNQLSAHHVKGLRSLYNQQQLVASGAKLNTSLAQQQQQQQQQEPRSMSSASGGDDSQCSIM